MSRQWMLAAVLGSAVIALPVRGNAESRSADACEIVRDAMRKLDKAEEFLWVELHATSETFLGEIRSFSWNPTRLIRKVSKNTVTYMRYHGPVSSEREAIFADIEERNLSSCVHFSTEMMDKEFADIWTYQEQYKGKLSFGAMWISQDTDLPLKTEREQEVPPSADGPLRVVPTKYRRNLFNFGDLSRFNALGYSQDSPFRTFPKP
ncbi:hypothetical protein [Microvirga sp. Mcv34]|uniref:hypothetical protein n=1 Tax=Microvirga sp. Mcv34 TaxID=2926016 RepID=UPI0021CA2F6E|nr:hypothetical protein [Microvirga sp. Mcv34]